MRPVELVVRYFDDGDPLPQHGYEWAGVFVTSDDPEIEKAFADAEPPAHDDWQPDMLPRRSWGRTYVRVALGRIKDAAKAVAGGTSSADAGQRDGPSLGHVADLFGKALGSANRQGGSPRTTITGGGGGGGRRPFAISRPAFVKLDEAGDKPFALFRSEIRNETGKPLYLSLQPSIVIDGGGATAELEELNLPRVIAVYSDEGILEGDGDVFDLGASVGALHMAVSLPDDGAVMLKAVLREEAGS